MNRPRPRKPARPKCDCCGGTGVQYAEAISLPTAHEPVTVQGLIKVPCPFCRPDWRPRGTEPAAVSDGGEAVALPAPWVEPRGAGRVN